MNINGKNGLYMGKWMARKVFDSTRNVITAMPKRCGFTSMSFWLYRYITRLRLYTTAVCDRF